MALPAELLRELTRDEVNELPIRRYEGEVRLVESAAELERAIAEWRGERLVGFDTETRPAFKPGESYLPALAQIATAQRVYLLPLQRLDCKDALRTLLAQEHTAKAGRRHARRHARAAQILRAHGKIDRRPRRRR